MQARCSGEYDIRVCAGLTRVWRGSWLEDHLEARQQGQITRPACLWQALGIRRKAKKLCVLPVSGRGGHMLSGDSGEVGRRDGESEFWFGDTRVIHDF